MKFDIQRSFLLSLGLLCFSVAATDLRREPYHDAVHLLRRATPLTNGTSTGRVIPSSSRPSLPPSTIPPSGTTTSRAPSSDPTNPPITTSRPVSSAAPTSTAPVTTTVSNGDTIIVAVGVVVVGGPGGGFFTVAGSAAAPVAVGAGTAVTASSSSEGDKPDDPDRPPSSAPPASSDPPKESTSTNPDSSTSTSTRPARSTYTSSVPSGTPTPCVIFPKDGATDQEKKDFLALLDKELGTGNYRETSDTVVLFVSANITAAQETTISSDPLVGGIEPVVKFDTNAGASVPVPNSKRDEDVHEKWWMESLDKLGRIRKRAVVKQDRAPTELIMFSQPPLVDLAVLKSYTYDDSAGADITVYVLDSGYYTRNTEYTGMAIKPRWIFAGAQADRSVEEDADPGGHGSCAGSKVNGPKYGVAKKTNLVVVKAGDSSVDTLDGLNKILEDVRSKKLQGKAIVNFSRSIDKPTTFNRKMIEHYVKEMIREDIVFFAASGNDDREEVADGKATAIDVDAWPPMMAADGVPIINVGAVDNTGKNASFSQGGPLVHVMAPGVQVQCAANSFVFGTQKKDGTSFAAPAVAGLAAYLLALGEYPELYQTGKVAENMKKLLMDMAYQRTPDGGQVAFNGQGAVCSRPSSAKFRRQDLSGEACSVVSSTTTIPPTPTSAPPPPPPASTSNPPAETTAPPPPPPPAPKTLFSLEEQVDAGTTACFPTAGFSTTPGTTYGFSFDVDAGMLVSIQTGSTDEGYHQSQGPWTGTFYAESGSALKICATGTGSGSLPLTFAITEEPSQPVKAPSGREVFKLDEKVQAGVTSCFPTTGLNIQEGNYGFSYTTADGVIVQIGDSSSGPKYFSGNRASGSGLMYIDFSGGSISICATNGGSAEASLSLSMTQ
ncbi:Putative peptidase S8/S53 domain, peptidase S8, subtilisin, Ser-active [Colletotrichum destructivum]|uniref:Peptidase S8/S53 domain, peptidase S8, subtilisin, Ser-active n=1 Tax=Colletotrichum destructivum TaxID=34406 RepID=A0AAX4IKC9_9PEZI|nr:Putative peptidase S8/S53 domain, peptidase S8, subtilisin, Ser-active [Colletotrichum destructivum]